MLSKTKSLIKEYPKTFWLLVFSSFVDHVGGFMLFPFFSLYLSKRFEVGMVEVGFLFTFFSLGAIFGGTFGGLLTDKYGRKSTMLLGLIASGLGSIAMAFAETLIIFYILAIISGLLGMVGDPARSAMVADLLPPEKQADGFGVLRIAINLSAAIGPAIGGIVAGYGFNYIFFADAASSLITAVIVIVVIKETKPKNLEKTKSESIWKTFEGYKSVLKDRIFMFFLLINIFLSLAYLQLYSTLSVFLIDNHEFSEQNYGLLISLNALIVVIFQFPITRKISKNKPFIMMGVGAIFYAIGFGMIGFISSHYLFFVAIIIITIGEMIIAPFGRSLVAKFASEDKRGRYMAVFGLSWGFPNLFGVVVAGYIMDYLNPVWIWYFAGILCIISTGGFLYLNKRVNENKVLESIEE